MLRLTISDDVGGLVDSLEAGITGLRRLDTVVLPDGSRERLLDGVADDWITSRRVMYATYGASTGTPWPAYTREESLYAAIKSRILGRPMLRGDVNRWVGGRERLYPSLTQRAHPEHIRVIGRNSVTLGTRVPYAMDLHLGRGRAPERLGGGSRPPRPLIALGGHLRRLIDDRLIALAARLSSAIVRGRRGPSKADVVRTRGGRL